MEQTQQTQKTFRGTVVSDATDKTVVVEVGRYVQHPQIRKYVTKRKRFKAHDPENQYAVGDVVDIELTKPVSKSKHFIVVGKVA